MLYIESFALLIYYLGCNARCGPARKVDHATIGDSNAEWRCWRCDRIVKHLTIGQRIGHPLQVVIALGPIEDIIFEVEPRISIRILLRLQIRVKTVNETTFERQLRMGRVRWMLLDETSYCLQTT